MSRELANFYTAGYALMPFEHIFTGGGRKRCTHKRKAGGRSHTNIWPASRGGRKRCTHKRKAGGRRGLGYMLRD